MLVYISQPIICINSLRRMNTQKGKKTESGFVLHDEIKELEIENTYYNHSFHFFCPGVHVIT